MLTFLLVAAGLQLAAAYGCFAAKQFNGGTVLFWLCGFLSLLISPLLLLQFLALLLTGLLSRLACWAPKAQPRYFWAAATLVSAAIFVAFGLQGPREWSARKQRYPIESLSDRLAYETSRRVPSKATAVDTTGRDGQDTLPGGVTLAAMEQLDRMFAEPSVAYEGRRRAAALSLIHASYVTQFVNSPGFGVGRDGGRSSKMLSLGYSAMVERLNGPVPMPGVPDPSGPNASAQDASSAVREQTPRPAAHVIIPQLESMHRNAQVDFVNVSGFGYIQDRAHVVGFQSHRFTELPSRIDDPTVQQGAERRDLWETRRVELVSLLKHEQPMVYLSTNLPRMDDLRNAPVRPLDAFEEESLPALRAGGNIQTRDYGDRMRMLGAVRAARQCLNCHEVQHGALLGAFSYEFGSGRTASPRPSGAKPRATRPAL